MPRDSPREARKQAEDVWLEFASAPDPLAALAEAFQEEWQQFGSDAGRAEYRDAVESILGDAIARLEQGQSLETVARWAHSQRRSTADRYRENMTDRMVGFIYARNLHKYGDPFGPTYEHFVRRGRTAGEILKSATRSGGADLGLKQPPP